MLDSKLFPSLAKRQLRELIPVWLAICGDAFWTSTISSGMFYPRGSSKLGQRQEGYV